MRGVDPVQHPLYYHRRLVSENLAESISAFSCYRELYIALVGGSEVVMGVYKMSELQGNPWSDACDRIRHIAAEYEAAETPAATFDCLRRIYAEAQPIILAGGPRGRTLATDFVRWRFSPIEFDAWVTIRGFGIRLYPQVPVSRYFLDFANPFHKVGVELDGARWHEVGRDTARDQHLAGLGWRIFRVPGRQAVKAGLDISRVDELPPEELKERVRAWAFGTSDGVIRAVDAIFLRGKGAEYYNWWGTRPGYPDGHWLLSLFHRTLNEHRLADFQMPELPEEEEEDG